MLIAQEITERVLQERLALTASSATVTRNYHLAEDVYQEIFVKAVALTDQFESTAHLTNWFRVSARNRAIDIIRTREGRYSRAGRRERPSQADGVRPQKQLAQRCRKRTVNARRHLTITPPFLAVATSTAAMSAAGERMHHRMPR